MKNTLKKLLAFVLVCTMLVSLGAVGVFAMEVDESIYTNWTPMAAYYTLGSDWKIKAPKSNNYEIQTEGFKFTENEYGGISAVNPKYDTVNKGTYSTSVFSSKATTPLDGLTVVLTADQYDSYLDSAPGGNSLGILWTEERIEEIAGFNAKSKKYETGLFSAEPIQSNGLRGLIPHNSEARVRTPANSELAQAEHISGRALYIGIRTDFQRYEDARPVATTVHIVYYDGHYINDDGNPGYRWSFTARNHENTSNGDYTGISHDFLDIDLSEGIVVKVRADETHGYIVSINDVDYYKGEDVGYFPDAYADDWTGYTGDDVKFTDEEYETLYPNYTRTMTHQRTDVDLNGLKNAEGEEPAQGYLTIGGSSNNDKSLLEHHCSYSVAYVNGVSAARWAGEVIEAKHECSTSEGWTVATPATCTTKGTEIKVCETCASIMETRETEIDPDVHREVTEFAPVLNENSNWEGKAESLCKACGEVVNEKTIDLNEIVGNYEDVETNAWYVGGIAYCTYKGYMSGTSDTTAEPNATLTRAQFVTLLANLNGADLTRYAYVDNDFIDVSKSQWFYKAVTWAAAEGYANGVGGGKFDPDANVTRAQLAKFFYVYSEKNGGDMTPTNDLSDFSDGTTVPGWAVDYIKWAVGSGLINGMNGAVNGDGFATRAQASKIFMVFDNLK